ncbi:phospholipase A2 inhibitor beta-like isoform X3 [Hydractinia symbiolongicarpus]|uniref:phospholipase A2 inhibitor beta-like isoform X3 n=1 Tax=Hydractinia symbiolongicarpus TaxID=13093 RepID=UPI00254E155D|nr:phospholipase A2 inhibitor beta-like isoform X3 [Hydractinia symbiolongicarpus]
MLRYVLLFLCYVDITFCFECVQSCSCRSLLGLQTLICYRKGFTKFPNGIDNNTEFLRFEGNQISILPDKLWKIVPHLQKINLFKNRINTIDDHVFLGIEKLKVSLNLKDNNISRIHENAFAGLYSDIDIDLSKNSLKTFHQNTFRDLRGLITLNLARNLFEELPKEIFKNQESLWFLDLSNNKLQNIRKDVLIGLKNLKTLDLSSNNINKIPTGLFEANPKLETLRLIFNNFSYPPSYIPEHIKTITLLKNPIKCDCTLHKLLSNSAYKAKLKDINQITCVNETKTVSEALMELNCVPSTTAAPTTIEKKSSSFTGTTKAGGHVKVETTDTISTTMTTTSSKRITRTTSTFGGEKIKRKRESNLALILGIVLGVIVLIVVAVLFTYLYRRLIAEKIYEAATLTLPRKKREKSCTTSTDDLAFHGWNEASTAMLAKTEGTI